jgi:hypothetical protein
LLLEKPCLDTNILWPYLAEALPHYKGVRAQLSVNLWNPASELMMKDTAALTSHNKSAADEMISTDDPMISKKNHTDLLRRVLAKDSATWKALRYPAFNFRFKHSSDGTPEGLIWMTLNMREHLLRYGDIRCLDIQARQYNSSGFPCYCSLIAISSDKQNTQTSEALVVEERV